jgi:pyruvate dehydrogenase E1 component
VIWGDDWDPLLAQDYKGLLAQRMNEVVDGQYQKYTVESGEYIRKDFFGKYPETLNMVSHLSDKQLQRMRRGGHDPEKVYAAFKTAVEHEGSPTVVLAKTIKGYGLGEAGEGKNITHQQKKLNEAELKYFRDHFDIPVPDDKIKTAPFYKPPQGSEELEYLLERRHQLGGFVPQRKVFSVPLEVPTIKMFEEFFTGTDREVSTTMAFVQMLRDILKHPSLGNRIVPIVPDEARTFGMESLFRQCGIYSHVGQMYEPVDANTFLYYKEAKDGQILEEGITEAGAMSSFTAAGTAHATHGIDMIPFFIFYSMFGFQRVGDLIWAFGDLRGRGFLLGATSGRTTLNGEGLQHEDGHSHVLASTIPNLLTYDPTYAYEIAVIIQNGMKRMYHDREDIFYYITLGNENYAMAAMPAGVTDGILKGLYKFRAKPKTKKGKRLHKAHIFGSGSILREALRASELLDAFGVSADVWSATSYKELRRDALACERWNMLHPTKTAKKPYVVKVLEKEEGPFVAASDYMKIVPEQINRWVPGGLYALGTDGYGRSDSREALRRFFEVDAESIAVSVLYQLAGRGKINRKVVQEAIDEFGIDAGKVDPVTA